MADNNTLNIKIGAQIEGLKKSLDNAKSEVNGFGNKLENTLKGGAKSSVKLTDGVKKSSKAIQEADKYTNGLASALIDVSDSAKVAGNGMKTALITSGIGAAVIALGLIVQHWDDIKNLIDDSNVKLRQHIQELQRGADIVGGEIDLNKKREAFLKYQGKSTEDIVNANRELYAKQQSLNVLALHNLKIENAKLTSLSTQATWWEKLRTLQSGRIATTKKQSEEDKKAAAERLKEINNLEQAIEGVKFDVFKIDNPKAKVATATAQMVSALEGAKAILTPVGEELKSLLSITPPEETLGFQSQQYKEYLAGIAAELQSFNDQASNIINNGITNTFAALGQGIGDALASGASVLEGAGKGLLSSLGGILIQLGELAIATGVGIASIKNALKSLNPAVAIAAGIALIALGSFVSSKAAKIGTGSGGGGRRGSTDGVGGSGSRSYSGGNATSRGSFGGGTVVFEISGTKLVGVLNRTLNRNTALGGNYQLSGT